MKKQALVLAAVLAACTTMAFAAPSPSLEKGQTQLDLGAWNVKHNFDLGNDSDLGDYAGALTQGQSSSSDSKWNFWGGLTYGISDKVSVEYAYHGLKTKSDSDLEADGNEHEINLIYGINKNFGVYAGWNRIKNSFSDLDANNTNNAAQIGLIAKAAIGSNSSIYARGAIGTSKTALWEAGVGIGLGKNVDLNAAYRYVNTKLTEDDNITYKGFIAGLSFRFGGGAPVAAPVVEEPAAVTPAPVAAPAELKDYYLDSIHFDFDVDTPKATENGRLANFVNVAKANPNDTFKLVGDTDAKGGDSYNDDLSKRRVMNVAKYATNNGVPASQLKLGYRGKTDPAETNATEEGRAANRRVDIWWTK
jgi:OOP family OmpA-OmpF porin